jgi:hypothetical protein
MNAITPAATTHSPFGGRTQNGRAPVPTIGATLLASRPRTSHQSALVQRHYRAVLTFAFSADVSAQAAPLFRRSLK